MWANTRQFLALAVTILLSACCVSIGIAPALAGGTQPASVAPGGGSNAPWTSYYADPRPDRCPEYHNVAICPDGTVVAVGSDGDNVGSDPGELIVGRYTQDGKLLPGWPRFYAQAGMRWNEGQDVFVEPNGDMTIGGYMITTGNVWNLAVWRLDSEGNPLPGWPKYMHVSDHSYGTAAIVDSDGNIVACGYARNAAGTVYSLLVVKYTASGTIVSGWPRTYQVSGTNTVGYDIIQDSDGNLVAAGYGTPGAGDRDAALFKMDTDGNLAAGWPKTWTSGGALYDEYSSVTQDSNGQYCLVGLTQGAALAPPYDSGKLLVNRYTKAGAQVAGWPKTDSSAGMVGYHPPDTWHGAVDSEGNIAASFTRQADTSVHTNRYAPNGAMSPGFPQVLNRAGYSDEAHATNVDDKGNVYTVGMSISNSDPDGDYTTFVAKYTPATFTWYLAEGSTGVNEFGYFETWILVQNPGDESADVQLFYQTPSGEVPGQQMTLAPHSRDTRSVADVVPGEWSVSTRVVSNRPIIAERSMYWDAPGAFRQSATDSIGVTSPAKTWYLAEGSTGANEFGWFETWVLVQNPGDEPANVKYYYQTPDGQVEGHQFTVKPHARETRNVADVVPNQFSVSTKVTSDQPVIAERAMYWCAPGAYRAAAHDSIGVTAPCTAWYLAEGSTGTNEQGSFETWVLVQNPGSSPAHVQLYYQTPTTEVKGHELTVGAHSRETRNVADFLPNEFSVSTRVDSDEPVIAERSMYWTGTPGSYRQSATDSVGVTAPCGAWYLAEGCTGASQQGCFETWVLVQNPGDTAANVRLYYQTPRGVEVAGQEFTLTPHTRKTLNVADCLPNEFSVSTRVASDQPVIAERAMYWDTATCYRQCAHDSIGFDP